MASSGVNSGVLPNAPDADEVRRELGRVLSSPAFRGSKRCHDFLEYVVLQVLDGDGEKLKERTLAIEVFGRSATNDLADDSIVRVGAREVRKRLAQYYVGDGANDPVRIDLPAGSYLAVFQHHTAPVEPVKPPAADSSRGRRLPAKFAGRRVRLPAIAAILIVGSALAWRLLFGGAASAFDQFWRPVFHQKTPIALLLAHPIVYYPSSRATRLDQERNGATKLPLQRAISLPPELLSGSDFVPVIDQFVGFGDAVAALRINTLLVQHGGSARVRLASKVEFSDLVGSSAILIGAFTNRWTIELTDHFRFQFGYHDGKPCINDLKTGRRWTLTTKADNGRSAEDYVLLCRLPHSQTNGLVLVCAGLNVYGTEEAGRILSEPESLTRILRKLPGGWENRNLEVILHVEVVGDAPALPEVVAVHTW